jgi:hypothetical protein
MDPFMAKASGAVDLNFASLDFTSLGFDFPGFDFQ